jgi:hypothetical protein
MVPVEAGQPCSDGVGNVGLFIPQSAPQARMAILVQDFPVKNDMVRPVPPATPGQSAICLFMSGGARATPRTGGSLYRP